MKTKVIVKDDRNLFDMIDRETGHRRWAGLPDGAEAPGDAATLKANWQRMRATRQSYHVVIEPVDSRFQAYPLVIPQLVVQGDTPEAARDALRRALRRYADEQRVLGHALPVDNKRLDVISLTPIASESTGLAIATA